MSVENGTMKLLSWVGGAVGFLIIIYTTFHVPLTQAIQDEAKTRSQEDSDLRQDFVDACAKNHEQYSEIKIMMAEIKSDLKYIKKNGQNN